MNFSETPTDVVRHLPDLGEHTVGVLRELRYLGKMVAELLGDVA